MKLKVIKEPNPVLRKRSAEVPLPLSDANEKLLRAMFDYVVQSQNKEYALKKKIREGVGIAAPQVGFNLRMIAISYAKGDKRIEYALVNPKVVSSSIRQVALPQGEGCLSVEISHEGYVYRANKVTVEAYDLFQDKVITIIAHDFDAIVLQHEIDHLNGVLFYDRINSNNPFEEKVNSYILKL
jgi:peptide deformylase